MKRFANAIKQIKLKDFLAPFVFLLMLIPSIIFRLINKIKHRKLWLVTEDGEARDNGYHFYRYVREEHPNDFCFYAVKPNAAGYERVAKLGNIIRYGRLNHWLYYMSANLNISSQKSGNPCPMFWYFIHVILGWYKNRVFLQHGITKDDADWLYYNKTKFKYFVCGAEKEYNYIKRNFGYPEKSLLLTGFPRWDELKNNSKLKGDKSILIMPTWRNWLGGEKNKIFETKDFKETKYFKYWNAFLNDDNFIEFIEKNNIKVYFYPHINMQMFLHDFESKSKNVKVVSINEDIQEYLNKCDLMITDYSSVAFDFAYLNKPVVYYQFDQKEYRKKQYPEGYFKYERDGFGPVVKDVDEVLEHVTGLLMNSYDENIHDKIDKFFVNVRGRNFSANLYNILNSKNVLYSTFGLTNGGVEKYILTLIKQNDFALNNVIVYQDGSNYWRDELKEMNIDVIKLPSGFVRRVRILKKIMANNDIDLVYACNYYGSAYVVLAAYLSGVKIRITHSHGTGVTGKPNKIKVLFARALISIFSTDCFACGSKAGESLFIGRKFKIINNGIDINKYVFDGMARKKLRKELGIGDDSIVIGTVGRLDENKNQKFMIKILEFLRKEKGKYKLVIIGTGREKTNLENYVKKKHLSNKVIFIGDVKDVSKYYNVFDIFLLTSFHEGFPFVLIEAQANGLPCVISSGVSKEVAINTNCVFMDLHFGAEKWAALISNVSKERVNPDDKIENYSIQNITKNIEEILTFNGANKGGL